MIKKAVLGLNEPTPKIDLRMMEEEDQYKNDDEYKMNGASFSSLLGPTLSPTPTDHTSSNLVSPLMSPEMSGKSKIPNEILSKLGVNLTLLHTEH